MTQHLHELNLDFVTIAGEDRFSFLQSLVSADTTPLKENYVVWSNLLSPQGRILFNFLIIPIGDGLWLNLPSSQVEELYTALTQFHVKEKVRINTHRLMSTCVSLNPTRPTTEQGKVSREGNVISFIDPRSPLLGVRSIQPKKHNTHPQPSSSSIYSWMRFRAGVIEETSSPEGRNLLPLEVGHHIFQAINFKKGCFIGQEVNMRLFHRGSIKRTLKGAFSLSPMDEPIPVGTVISLPPPFKARVVKSLLNQKKQWAGLIFIEGQQHHTQSFFSLSYNDTILSLSPPNPPQENTHG